MATGIGLDATFIKSIYMALARQRATAKYECDALFGRVARGGSIMKSSICRTVLSRPLMPRLHA
jgi:hypothetical protein